MENLFLELLEILANDPQFSQETHAELVQLQEAVKAETEGA